MEVVLFSPESAHDDPELVAAKVRPGASSQARLGKSAESKKEPQAAATPGPSPLFVVSRPAVDWDEEASKVARKQISEAENIGPYRDLAGLSAEQKKRLQRVQIKPVPHDPFWDNDNKSRLMFPGGFYITNDCAMVNLLPVCEIKLGKRKARGDLFKDMKKYLDEIDSNPLP